MSAPTINTLVTLDEIIAARARIQHAVRATPVEHSDTLSRMLGRSVSLKPEFRQVTGSYKIRGATNRIALLAPGVGVVAASAGNHAQGVARAASLSGHRATIFMPETAALPKVEATRADGADVRLHGAVVDDCLAAARAYAEDTGSVLIHPFDDPAIIAGQGTVGLEIAEEMEGDAVVLVPVGGGGLISGVAAALRALRPAIRIIGIEAEGAAGMRASMDAGHVVTLDSIATIADGIAVKAPSALTLAHVEALVDEVVTVTDDQIAQALLVLLERVKAVVEPAGAVGLAALLAGKIAGTGPVLTVLSGGNVDPILLTRLIEHGLSAAGRYLLLRVVVDDQPGALARLTATVASLGLNVLEVEHHRVGLRLGVDKVEVALTLETRDPGHVTEVLDALRAQGYGAATVA